MAEASCTFETGTNGNAILVADTGSATAWNGKAAFSGNTATYDNTHSYDTLAGKYDNTPSPASSCYLDWTTGIGTLTDWFGRLYLYCTANPSGGQYRIMYDLGANQIFRITTTGKVEVIDASSTTAVITTTSISLNQWVRIEWHCIHSATVGQWEVKLFNNPDSSTPTETVASAANRNTGVSTNDLAFGLVGTAAGPVWLDNIVAGATSYPGPVPIAGATANLAPVIYGRGAC